MFLAIALNVLDRGDRDRVGTNSPLFRDLGGCRHGHCKANIVDVD